MSSSDKFLSTPFAVLLGSFLISISILIHGGYIDPGRITGNVPVVSSVPSDDDNQSKVVKNLKLLVSRLGLDQGKFDTCLDSGENAALIQADYNDGTRVGVTGTPNFFINGHLLAGNYPYQDFKSVIDFELEGGNWSAPSPKVEHLVDGNPNNGEIGKTKVDVPTGNLPILGNENAKVTVVEFSDYECPICEAFYTQSEKQFKAEYLDSGKVKFYYRDFPLSQIHPGAQKAAEAARCAGSQGKYWEYHNLIFENRNQIF